MMRSEVVAVLAMVAGLAGIDGVRAETAEQAVAYVFMGLADGATFKRDTSTFQWRETSPSPAVFDGAATVGGETMDVRFTVIAVDPCHYEVNLKGPMVPGGGETLFSRINLSAVEDLSIDGEGIRVELRGEGVCETGPVNRDCMPIDRMDLFGFVDRPRHAETLAFIRKDVCPGMGGGSG